MFKSGLILFLFAGMPAQADIDREEELPPFERSVLTKAAEKRIFSKDENRNKEIDKFLSSRPSQQVDLKDDMPPVRNQGSRGTCSNFAAMALVEHFVDKNADYSEQCLAFHSGEEDPGVVEYKVNFMRTNGLYKETDCPYVNGRSSEKWPLASLEEREILNLEARNTMPQLTNVEKLFPSFRVIAKHVDALSDGQYLMYIQTQLDNLIPVGAAVVKAGTEWLSGMIIAVPSVEEIKEECEKKKALISSARDFEICSSHVIVLTGYDDEKKLIYFKNSWDTTWGLDKAYQPTTNLAEKKGYGAFSYAYLTKFRLNSLVTLAK